MTADTPLAEQSVDGGSSVDAGLSVDWRTRTGWGLAALTLVVVALLTFGHAQTLRNYRTQVTQIHRELEPWVRPQVAGMPGRFDPAGLPRALNSRTPPVHLESAPKDPDDLFASPIARAIDHSLERFADELRSAARMRAFYLAERAQWPTAGKDILRRAVEQLVQRVAHQPVEALGHYELANTAARLADLEDDRPTEERIARAARLRRTADLAMARTLRLSSGTTSHEIPYLSSFYLNLRVGEYFMARYRENRSQDEAAEALLANALVAFDRAIAFDDTPVHIERVIRCLRDPAESHNVDWDTMFEFVYGLPAGATMTCVDILAGRDAPVERLETAVRAVLADSSSSRALRSRAQLGLMRLQLLTGAADEAGAELDRLLRTSASRDRDLHIALAMFRQHSQLPVFRRVAESLLTELLDFRTLHYACGLAAFAAADRTAAERHLVDFLEWKGPALARPEDVRRAKIVLAKNHGLLDKWNEASTLLRQLYKEDPSDVQVGLDFARTLLALNDITRCREIMRDLVARYPTNAAVQRLADEVGRR